MGASEPRSRGEVLSSHQRPIAHTNGEARKSVRPQASADGIAVLVLVLPAQAVFKRGIELQVASAMWVREIRCRDLPRDGSATLDYVLLHVELLVILKLLEYRISYVSCSRALQSR